MKIQKILTATLVAASILCAMQYAQAGLVSWEINSSLSSLRLAIPDQSISIDDTPVTIRIRNQTGATTSWNTGNVAAVAGTLLTNYVGGPSPSIQFLPSTVGQTVGVDSGSYRPDLSTYSGGTVNPDGSASGGFFANTTAPAVYGGRMRATVLLTTVDGAYLSFNDLSYSTTSGLVSIDPLTGQFATNQTNFGLLGGLLGVDFVSTLLPAEMQDSIIAIQPASVVNTGGIGIISAPIDSPLARQLTLPVRTNFAFDLGGTVLQATLTGTIVATAIPEPSSSVLLALGAAACVAWVRRGRRAMQ